MVLFWPSADLKGPPTVGRIICFTQFTNLNANSSKNTLQKHQVECGPSMLFPFGKKNMFITIMWQKYLYDALKSSVFEKDKYVQEEKSKTKFR